MNPEERNLLERAVKLGEQNNRELRAVRRHMHWSVVWGFVKFLLIAVPLVIGYFYVQTNFGASSPMMNNLKDIIDSLR